MMSWALFTGSKMGRKRVFLVCPCCNPPFNSFHFTHSRSRRSLSWPSSRPLISSRHPVSLIPHPCLRLLPPLLSSQSFSFGSSPYLAGSRSQSSLWSSRVWHDTSASSRASAPTQTLTKSVWRSRLQPINSKAEITINAQTVFHL